MWSAIIWTVTHLTESLCTLHLAGWHTQPQGHMGGGGFQLHRKNASKRSQKGLGE
jgi:hypothetical protein